MASRGRPQPARHRSSPARRWEPVLLGVAALVALATISWAVQSRRDDSGPLAEGDPGVSHVHGLGVDPADGTLYAATHHGLFRIPDEGEASRVADRYQDTMGFTVVGPHRFLGSGHPDIQDEQLYRKDRPPLLGLIESTDAGKSWRSLSLLGQADFHALAATHDRVYGFSATDGKFMVSKDGKHWEARSGIGLVSFAVDPDDPDHILGAAQQGLVDSRDGGRTWRGVPSPPLAFLSWDSDGGLWGAGPTGEVHHSADGGSSWQRAGDLPGQPEALLVEGDTLYAAVAGEGIFRSTDAGGTWQLRYRDP